MSKSIIQSMKEYMEQYPKIKEMQKRVCVDFLKEDNYSFSIEPIPSKTIIGGYIGGMIHKQYPFVLAVKFPYSQEVKMNIENSGFFEDLENWIENNNNNDILPELPEGYKPDSIEVGSSGFLFGVTPDMKTGRYQMQLRLTYWTEEE